MSLVTGYHMPKIDIFSEKLGPLYNFGRTGKIVPQIRNLWTAF